MSFFIQRTIALFLIASMLLNGGAWTASSYHSSRHDSTHHTLSPESFFRNLTITRIAELYQTGVIDREEVALLVHGIYNRSVTLAWDDEHDMFFVRGTRRAARINRASLTMWSRDDRWAETQLEECDYENGYAQFLAALQREAPSQHCVYVTMRQLLMSAAAIFLADRDGFDIEGFLFLVRAIPCTGLSRTQQECLYKSIEEGDIQDKLQCTAGQWDTIHRLVTLEREISLYNFETYLFDIDGTLTNGVAADIDPCIIEKIITLLKRGKKIVLCSGRTFEKRIEGDEKYLLKGIADTFVTRLTQTGNRGYLRNLFFAPETGAYIINAEEYFSRGRDAVACMRFTQEDRRLFSLDDQRVIQADTRLCQCIERFTDFRYDSWCIVAKKDVGFERVRSEIQRVLDERGFGDDDYTVTFNKEKGIITVRIKGIQKRDVLDYMQQQPAGSLFRVSGRIAAVGNEGKRMGNDFNMLHYGQGNVVGFCVEQQDDNGPHIADIDRRYFFVPPLFHGKQQSSVTIKLLDRFIAASRVGRVPNLFMQNAVHALQMSGKLCTVPLSAQRVLSMPVLLQCMRRDIPIVLSGCGARHNARPEFTIKQSRLMLQAA